MRARRKTARRCGLVWLMPSQSSHPLGVRCRQPVKLSIKKEALLASKRHAQEAGGDDGEAAMIGGSE
jgi:hypothetical protein